MKYKLTVKHFNIYNILFLILLLSSFLIRIINFSPSYYGNDFNQAYLVGSHIIKYHEFPLGAMNSTMMELKSSPTFFYFIALILLLNNHPLFISYFNILLQLSTIVIIYILAKKAFGNPTGLIAAALFSFSKVSLDQSIFFIWQPHVMQPFVNLSYLFLLLAYIKKNAKLVMLGVIVFIFAGSLHNSVFSLLPFYLLISLFILRRLNLKVSSYILLLLITLFSFGAFFSSSIIYWYKSGFDFFGIIDSRVGSIQSNFMEHFTKDTAVFFNNFFFISNKDPLSVNLILLMVSIFIILFYLFIKKIYS